MDANERARMKEMWFSDYQGPTWFMDFMLDGESTYTSCWGRASKAQNLDCAIMNKIDTYSPFYGNAKHSAQNFIQNRINKLTTDRQCVNFIKKWVDENFKKII
jgi:hypothetical protein